MAARTYLLKPRLPVRALGIAASLTLLGALLIVIPNLFARLVGFLYLGGILMIAGFILIALALINARRMEVRAVFDDAGFLIAGQGTVSRGEWRDVTRVTAAPGRLTLHVGDERKVQLLDPQLLDSRLALIGAHITERLAAIRSHDGL